MSLLSNTIAMGKRLAFAVPLVLVANTALADVKCGERLEVTTGFFGGKYVKDILHSDTYSADPDRYQHEAVDDTLAKYIKKYPDADIESVGIDGYSSGRNKTFGKTGAERADFEEITDPDDVLYCHAKGGHIDKVYEVAIQFKRQAEALPVAAPLDPVETAPIVVKTVQHYGVDDFTLTAESLATLKAGISYFDQGTSLAACMDGDADPSQENSYNVGLSGARVDEVTFTMSALGAEIAGRYAHGERRAIEAGSPDNVLNSEFRRVVTFIYPEGALDVHGAPSCQHAVDASGADVVSLDEYRAQTVEAHLDGEWKPDVLTHFTR